MRLDHKQIVRQLFADLGDDSPDSQLVDATTTAPALSVLHVAKLAAKLASERNEWRARADRAEAALVAIASECVEQAGDADRDGDDATAYALRDFLAEEIAPRVATLAALTSAKS